MEVNYVSNFTDVDDKIIKKANEEGVEAGIISERYIAECKKVASELKKSDVAYAKAAAAFTKKPSATNQHELSVAKADLEACVAGYNALVNNISAALVEIKNNYALINDYVHVVDAAKAAKHSDDYANYSASIEKTMNAIAKSLRNCKSVEK